MWTYCTENLICYVLLILYFNKKINKSLLDHFEQHAKLLQFVKTISSGYQSRCLNTDWYLLSGNVTIIWYLAVRVLAFQCLWTIKKQKIWKQPVKFGSMYISKIIQKWSYSFKVCLGNSLAPSILRSVGFHVETFGMYLSSPGKLR